MHFCGIPEFPNSSSRFPLRIFADDTNEGLPGRVHVPLFPMKIDSSSLVPLN